MHQNYPIGQSSFLVLSFAQENGNGKKKKNQIIW